MTMFEDALAEMALTAPQLKELPATVPGLTVHVDGDYMAYFASGNDECPPARARQNVLDLLHDAKSVSGADTVVMHNTVSGSNKGERYTIATIKPYQGQRDSDRKPRNYAYLRDYLLNYEGAQFKAKNWLTREADDGIGVMSHYAIGTAQGYAAIFTRDKDMQMLPGLHIDWLTRATTLVPPGAFCVEAQLDRGKPEKIRTYGLKFFWLQMLMGDTADHIPGLESYCTLDAKGKACIKRMGEKTAYEMLDGVTTNEEAYNVVSDLYVNYYQRDGAPRGVWAERFAEQAALLWMRTDNKAQVADFARHAGYSKISAPFCDQMWEAVARLEARVRHARTETDKLAG
jgi:hypothetical protein